MNMNFNDLKARLFKVTNKNQQGPEVNIQKSSTINTKCLNAQIFCK